jgi:hypothetical protein
MLFVNRKRLGEFSLRKQLWEKYADSYQLVRLGIMRSSQESDAFAQSGSSVSLNVLGVGLASE